MFIFELDKNNHNIVYIRPTQESIAWVPNLLYIFKNFLTYYEWYIKQKAYRIRFWDCFLVKEGFDILKMSHLVQVEQELYKKIVELNDYKNTTKLNVKLDYTPRLVQIQTVNFAMARNSCYVGHSRGVGKTACGFTTGYCKILNGDADHVLVLSPRSVIDKWENEIQEFLPEPYNSVVKVYVKGQEAAKKRRQLYFKPANFHIVTPETLARDIKWLECNFPWKKNYIVTDEHHKFKNKSARTTAIKKIRQKSVGIMAMTGHDINRSEQWYRMIDIVDPNVFGSQIEFDNQYIIKGDYNNTCFYKNQNMLAKKLDQIVFRKEKHEVLDQLPPKNYEYRIVPLTQKERKIYNSIKKSKVILKDEEAAVRLNHELPFTRYLRLRRFVCMPSLVSPEFDFMSSKMKELKSILEESNKEKIIIFSQWSTTCDAMELMIGKENCYKITGQSKDTPSKICNDFMRDKRKRVLIMDTAGALGIDAHGYMENGIWHHGADTLIFLDECFDHALNKQVEDRIHRYIDDEDEMKKWNVNIIIIRADNSVDTKLAESLDSNAKDAEKIFRIISGKNNMTEDDLQVCS